MSDETRPASDSESAVHAVDVEDAVEALDRKGATIVTSAAVALIVTIWVIFEAPAGPAVALAVLVLLGLKKAVMDYQELARKKTELLSPPQSATDEGRPQDV